MAAIEDVKRQLRPRSTTQERVRGLLAAGLHAADIAGITGVAVSSLRNWTSGQAAPRPDAAIVLDDLRLALWSMIDQGMQVDQAVQWLTSRNPEHFDDERPLDLLPTTPMSVVAAARLEAMDACNEAVA